MIMPCMNSTSACDHCGGAPFVVGGSVLLGFPGAPGCTTTGVAESLCCPCAAQQKQPAAPLAASSMPHSTADPLAERSLRSPPKRQSFHFRAYLNISVIPSLLNHRSRPSTPPG